MAGGFPSGFKGFGGAGVHLGYCFKRTHCPTLIKAPETPKNFAAGTGITAEDKQHLAIELKKRLPADVKDKFSLSQPGNQRKNKGNQWTLDSLDAVGIKRTPGHRVLH